MNEAEGFVIESPERERKTSEVGELIMNRLRRYDKVAYVGLPRCIWTSKTCRSSWPS